MKTPTSTSSSRRTSSNSAKAGRVDLQRSEDEEDYQSFACKVPGCKKSGINNPKSYYSHLANPSRPKSHGLTSAQATAYVKIDFPRGKKVLKKEYERLQEERRRMGVADVDGGAVDGGEDEGSSSTMKTEGEQKRKDEDEFPARKRPRTGEHQQQPPGNSLQQKSKPQIQQLQLLQQQENYFDDENESEISTTAIAIAIASLSSANTTIDTDRIESNCQYQLQSQRKNDLPHQYQAQSLSSSEEEEFSPPLTLSPLLASLFARQAPILNAIREKHAEIKEKERETGLLIMELEGLLSEIRKACSV